MGGAPGLPVPERAARRLPPLPAAVRARRRDGLAGVGRAGARQAARRHATVSPSAQFDVTDDDPGVKLGESVIEQLFRKTFIERAKALGGHGEGDPRRLGQQGAGVVPRRLPDLDAAPPGVARPDHSPTSCSSSSAAAAEPIAIYTDGKAFHATVGQQPARRRRRRSGDAARGLGYRVVAVTWADLNGDISRRDRGSTAAWAEKVAATGSASPLRSSSKLTVDPVTLLMEWMQKPDDEAKRRDTLARALPLILQPCAVSMPFGTASAARALPLGCSPTDCRRAPCTAAGLDRRRRAARVDRPD